MSRGLQKIYSELPKHYELIDHILTFGLDILCRRRAARIAVADGGERWLDMCCGTGEMATALKRLSRNGTMLTACDFSLPMLSQATLKPEAKDIRFAISEAGALPFADHTFDLITVSFATRNLNSSRGTLIKRFREFHRVLKPGGRYVNLETSQPESRVIRKLMHIYVGLTVKQVGSWISGSKEGYSYLASSIPRFYPAGELAEILREAGFSEISYQPLFFGITAIHKAVR
nr:ubiquinone/menaquinone biosynthesis methyltransferase [candidate division Zixibacteria bacterium]